MRRTKLPQAIRSIHQWNEDGKLYIWLRDDLDRAQAHDEVKRIVGRAQDQPELAAGPLTASSSTTSSAAVATTEAYLNSMQGVAGGCSGVTMLVNTGQATLLPEPLARFLASNPDIDVTVKERGGPDVLAAIHAGEAELGLVPDSTFDHLSTRSATHQFWVEEMRQDPVVAVAPPDHPIAARRVVPFAECLAHPLVGFVIYEAKTSPTGRFPELRYHLRLPGAEAVCHAVSAGAGIAIMPKAMAMRWAPATSLKIIDLSDPWAERRLMLCAAGHPETLSPAAAKLARWMIDAPCYAAEEGR